MSVHDTINVTVATIIATTVFWLLPLWLLVFRPRAQARIQAQNRVRRSGRYPMFGKPMTSGSVRAAGILMAVLTLGTAVFVLIAGYGWFFGIAAWAFLWIVLSWLDVSMYPRRFHRPMRWLLAGCFPLAIALAAAWVDYCGWVAFPLACFLILCALSLLIFLNVGLRKIPEH